MTFLREKRALLAVVVAMAGLSIPDRASAQWAGGYRMSTSGPGYSFTSGQVPGYGSYFVVSNTAGGVTTTMNFGAPPVFVGGPGYGYVVPGGPARGLSVAGPGYASSWGYTPGYGNSYQSTVSAGGVTTSMSLGAAPVYFAGPGYVYGYRPPHAQPRSYQSSNSRPARAQAPTLPRVVMPAFRFESPDRR